MNTRKTEHRIEINFSWHQFCVYLYKSDGVFDPNLQTATLYCLVLSPTDVQQPEVPPHQLGGILVLRQASVDQACSVHVDADIL